MILIGIYRHLQIVFSFCINKACLLNVGTGRPHYDTERYPQDGNPTAVSSIKQDPASQTSPNAAQVNDDDAKAASEATSGDGQPAQDAPEIKKPVHPMLASIGAHLEAKGLWDEFDELGTEMIVTKAGR